MASPTTGGGFADRRRPRGRPRVVLVECRGASDAADVEAQLAGRAMECFRVRAAGLAPPAASTGCEIALVPLGGQPALNAAVIDDVRGLKEGGYFVLCYAPAARAWPPGVQCRVLIAGASDLLDSSAPAFAEQLAERVDGLVRSAADREREAEALRQRMLPLGLVGSSRHMAAVFNWIARVSEVTDLPVLISGETGTGKELAARAIHRLDARRCKQPFVAVNCGAISASLAESELFGHRRGAFTGAEQERVGLIRAARGGVLFLDEVGDLEWNVQTKLLRVLQERRVLAVGEDHEVAVDVRVIAATNRDLEEMLKQHAFRPDLFHRLNVLSTRLPPLRERPEDIEPLVRHFLGRCAAEGLCNRIEATDEFLAALRHLELPGNVRQLENVIRRAVATSPDRHNLGLSDLPPELWVELSRAEDGRPHEGAATASTKAAEAAGPEAGSPLDPVLVLDAAAWKLQGALDLCEGKFVAAALGASRGNRSRAARLLGISPRCIFNKMRKHRLTA